MNKNRAYAVLSIRDLNRMVRAIRKARPGCKTSACGVLYADLVDMENNGNLQFAARNSTAEFKV